MQLSNKVYDTLKWLVQVVMPAVSALYFGLSEIWGLPSPENVVGTMAVMATFLGVVLGISTHQYKHSDRAYAGSMVVEENTDGGKIFSLELDSTPEEIQKMDELFFKVINKPD